MNLNPLQRWNQFLERIRGREQPQPSPVQLDLRRIFIMPTRSGIVYLVILIAMLIGSINYNNSLGYILTFTLVGLGLVAILHTFRNVFRIEVHLKHAAPVYAGGVARFELILGSEEGNNRCAIEVVTSAGVVRGIDIGEKGTVTVDLAQRYSQRGLHSLGRVTLRTIYPLGLFKAWAPLNIDARVVVYPTPAAAGPLPEPSKGGEASGYMSPTGDDDFHSMRSYQEGDSLRRVHWKGVAKGQAMMSKQYGGSCASEVWLDWHQFGTVAVEDRLSRLCQWVLDAEKEGVAYGLSIPGCQIEIGQGEIHKASCLEALALFGQRDSSKEGGTSG